MNKEIKKAQAILNEKDSTRKEAIAKAEAEKAEVKEKLAVITNALQNAKGAEEYKKMLAEKRDYEAVLEFCDKRIAQAGAVTLSPEDYKSITDTIKAAHDVSKNEHLAAILDECKKLNKLFAAFEADTKELNEIAKQAAILRGTNPLILSTQLEYSRDMYTRFYSEAYINTQKAEILKSQGLII